jgi:hypothetical protein
MDEVSGNPLSQSQAFSIWILGLMFVSLVVKVMKWINRNDIGYISRVVERAFS